MSEWAAKRFWKETTADEVEGGYAVHLDGRPVRTPLKTPLIVPTLKMAEAMREEWDSQGEKIDPFSMPVTRAANAALDKVAVQHPEVVDMLAAYGDSDLLCYRAESPEELVAKQAEGWDPLVDWSATELGAPLQLRTGIMHLPQDPKTLSTLHGHVSGLDAFRLTAFHDLVAITGSLILALAVTRGRLDSRQAWDLSRIDEEWQIAQWGADDEAEAHAKLKKRDLMRSEAFFLLCA
ncbi:ATP12 family chaperone protein [Litoreibacter janthinus]|uniref:Chaperone required for the assembly of the F1-ATPase n=1 Tax=Litoreibacter janthinus TaxID=670154 RepID=A0A1I6HZQ1_9RHOB|nr:ATP12 family protein [Litoreibacter janthinus]SFR59690.1 Chaperone required for the assembly of the F1-ATPase [Litoreibacter janthinus]